MGINGSVDKKVGSNDEVIAEAEANFDELEQLNFLDLISKAE